MIKKAIFFLLFISGVVYSQTVNGSVQNEDKQNLTGAIVSVEESNIGVVTDENGLFSIDLTDIDKSKYIVAYLGGYESYRIKVSDFINLKKPIITLKGKVIDLKEVGISPKKMSEKNLGVRKKSAIEYCGYDSELDKYLFKEYAIKIKNKKKIKLKNINITLTNYNIETPILLMFDIYNDKNDFPNESLLEETLSKLISNSDIKNNEISLDVSDKNIWIEEDFYVSVRTANDFKGKLILSGNVFAFSQDTYYRLYNGNWTKYSSGAPSINVDVFIKK